mmetsp:Transcript_61423/g.105704  ORF Transcript_61423/g.105704 Transcript_61423/m.105704 type:complete len:292 (-) Transcript_61423:119-994(-)
MATAEKRRDQAAQHDATKIGYTDHHPGMYSDRFNHKNAQTEAGRYNWLGDKYQDPDRKRPGRYRDKQFSNAAPIWYPGSNVEGNLYGLNGKRVPALRDGDQYPSVSAPVRKKDESTKVGFGAAVGETKFVPDMSTAQRQARYTHALKKEAKLQPRLSADDIAALEAKRGEPRLAWEAEPDMYEPVEHKENEYAQFIPGHLRDVQPMQTRQERQKKSNKPRSYGLQRPNSANIGEGVWAQQTQGGFTAAPAYKPNSTKYFTDNTHVGIPDVPGKDPYVKCSAQSYRIGYKGR